MALGLLGLKVGMTQVFDENGLASPVTVLQVGPCPILLVRDKNRDGYDAIQVGFLNKDRRKANRADRGHVANLDSKRKTARIAAGATPPPKADCEPQKHIREYRLAQPAEAVKVINKDGKEETLIVGKLLRVEEVFKDVKAVDVTAKSKGRGYTGVMKRHNFKGLRGSHGVKKGNRQRGSIASNASNRGSGRPKRGIRMAGQHGASPVTIRNLKLVKIDIENDVMLVMGAVPGPNGGLISVRPTNKKKSRHYRKPEEQKVSAAKKAAAAKKKK